MKFLYNIGVRSYSLAVLTAGMFGNGKAIKWVEGRKNWDSKLEKLTNKSDKVIWIHAASLGEYIQAKPLIKELNKHNKFSNYRIIVSFFSPSGYEHIKNSDSIDGITYLPVDTKKNAKKFLTLLNPDIAIFVKYDFWFNFLEELQTRNIPTIFFSCHFRPEQFYFKKSSEWQRSIMKRIDAIQTLNKNSVELLSKFNFNNALVGGDTRFDQVITNATNSQPIETIEAFKGNDQLLILGSSWPEEEDLLAAYFSKNETIKTIIAPHDISENHLTQIEDKFPDCIRYSKLTKANSDQHSIVLIDNIGMLSNLYQYGDISLIGGGFSNALHNTLEAAIFENVVLFGNHHSKYPEAQQLINSDGGIEISNQQEFNSTLSSLLKDKSELEGRQNKAREFITSNSGATKKLIEKIEELIN